MLLRSRPGRVYRLACALGCALITNVALPVSAAEGSTAQVRFTYENPKLQPAKYVLTVNEDGTGNYISRTGNAPVDQRQFPVRNQDRPIQVSLATREAIFATARRSNYFAMPCEGGDSRIAFQGTKTLEYTGADGHGSCTYNWSKDKQIEDLTSRFESISSTLEEGAKLEVEYEHSRLSLDTELENLSELVHDGHASELANIAPILQKIANDEAVLNRAKRRAQELLSAAGSGK